MGAELIVSKRLGVAVVIMQVPLLARREHSEVRRSVVVGCGKLVTSVTEGGESQSRHRNKVSFYITLLQLVCKCLESVVAVPTTPSVHVNRGGATHQNHVPMVYLSGTARTL